MTETKDLEPTQYFEKLKEKLSKVQLADLESQLSAISEQIVTAKELGQKNMLHKLSFVYKTILRERVLLQQGISQYVYKEDIVKYIESVKPKNSVKIIELERFPRVIPETNAKEILAAKEFFDEVCIVFTDFTDDNHQSETDKQVIARNKDPIAFGYFINEKASLRHDRFYFITDWEDEYCDLTLTKLVEELGKLGVKNPVKDIPVPTPEHINSIVAESLEEAEQASIARNTLSFSEPKKENFITKFFKLFSNGTN